MLSFAIEKENHKSIRVLSTPEEEKDAVVSLSIDKTSLTANNKFYIDFGEKANFHFFSAYPVSPSATIVVNKEDEAGAETSVSSLVHAPVWGIATVTKSQHPDVEVGTKYRAMLPMATNVSFAAVTTTKKNDMVVVRPKTNRAYNMFTKLRPDSVYCNPSTCDLALVAFPGIVTGFGLYHTLVRKDFYRSTTSQSDPEERTLVLSSASSKVALALALYLKQDTTISIKIAGYTSTKNRAFCESTGLYDELLDYGTPLPTKDQPYIVYIDIAGRSDTYKVNNSMIVKALVIGNSQGVSDQQATMSVMSYTALLKLMLTLMGVCSWIRQRLNPKLELFLIMDIAAELQSEWGAEEFDAKSEQATVDFCTAASKWMTLRQCDTDETIRKAFEEILDGTVPPSEAIVLDVGKALQDLK